MISVFGVQLANLAALGLLAAAPLALLAYRQRRTSKKILVSSLLILQDLQKRKTTRRRLKPPLRAYVELLALLLLGLAALMPALEAEGKRVAILLDSSLSMRARDTVGGETRFALAISAIENTLQGYSGGTRVSLFTSSPTLQQHGVSDSSPAAITAVLPTVQPSFAADSLDAQLIELAQSGMYEEVLVVTDRESQQVAAAASESKRTTISVQTIGQSVGNAYLANVQFREGDLQSDKDSLIATIGLSASAAQQAEVRVFTLDSQSNQRSQVAKSRVTLVNDSFITTELPLPRTRAQSIYQVELLPADPTQNAILEDDFAWIRSGSGGNFPVLLVTPKSIGSGQALGLESLRSLQVQVVSPEQYAALDEDTISKQRLVLFHQTAPAVAPKATPVLLIIPPSGNRIFPVAKEVRQPKLTSWDVEHPATLYLRVPLLAPSASAVFDVPDWAQSVIAVEEGSVLALGERRGVRLAAVGFELLPFEGSRTPAPSVLFLNILNWLSGSAGFGESLLTGSSFPLEAGTTWTVRTPARITEQLTLDREGSYPLPQPGPYSFQKAGSREPIVVTANSFYPQESATMSRATLTAPTEVAHAGEALDGGTPLWAYAMLLAVLLLLTEMALHLRSKEQFA